jgi:hypothetical protein
MILSTSFSRPMRGSKVLLLLGNLPLLDQRDRLLAHPVEVEPARRQEASRHAPVHPQEADQQVLGPDVGVHHGFRLVGGVGEDLLGLLRERQLGGRGDPLDENAVPLDLAANLLRLDVEAGEDLLDDVLTLAEDAEQQVLGLDHLGAELGGLVAGEEEGAAGFLVVLLKHRRVSGADSWIGSVPAGRTRRGRDSFPRHIRNGITATREIGVVRDENGRHAALPVKLFQETEDRAGGVGVEIAGRLVRKEETRTSREGARDRDTLLLASGEGAGPVVSPLPEADAVENVRGPAARLRRGQAGDAVRKRDILLRGELREKVVELEDEADAFVSKARPLLRRKLPERLAEDLHAPRVGIVDPAEQMQKRGLPDARGPHDRGEDPLRHLEREIRKHRDRRALAGVCL